MNLYEFKHKKQRLLIVGYGDIGKRILKQRFKYPNSCNVRDVFFEHFRVIIVSRGGLDNLDLSTRAIAKNKKIIELRLDLNNYKNIKKITKRINY